MSAFDYYPDSLPNALFDGRRQPGGLYTHMVDILSSMGKGALCNVNLDVDFFRRKKLDNWGNHYGYRTESNLEFSSNVFGEIVGEQYGTLLGPAGNHFPGRADEEPKPISDSSHIKPVIVLGKPSLCDEALEDYFHDQIVVFNQIRRADQREEDQDGQEYEAKEVIKGREGVDSEPSLIVLHGQLLYSVERESTSPAAPRSQPRVMSKRRANGAPVAQRQNAEEVQADPAFPAQDARRGRPMTEDELPGSEMIRVGAKYSPWVLPGYGGARFQQRQARVIQPDWRDARGQLIPPWKVWSVLRPGTVIMANVVVNVYVMSGAGGRRRKASLLYELHFTHTDYNQVYQASIQTLRVLGRSDVAVDKPTADFADADRSMTSGEKNDAASSALRNLVLPELDDDEGDSFDSGSPAESAPDVQNIGSRAGQGTSGASGSGAGLSKASSNDEGSPTEFLEDTEMQFMSNTRKGKKARRS
ncbi:hypothetical protein V5O48_003796 [Marasmius crinis-equi]|uniref:Uncharacterized protein n=1 Tax=Marasmius crinis-equi TaxID=585013 RepID=A0ABR3FRV6_9AGAR